MPRVIGIDPGSGSYDLCGLQDGKVFLDESIPTEQVAEKPKRLVDLVASQGKIDAAVVPSGYGLPLKPLHDLGKQDHFYLSLTKTDDKVTVPELRVSYEKMLQAFDGMGLNAYVLPGVIHLDTVPEHRKVNRIDIGTPDKLCSAALALHDQACRLHVDYDETSFILVEMGFAYTAALAVEDGRIVDGIGGTSGMLGFQAMGAMDGEVAYLLGEFGKDLLFRGGLASIAGMAELTPLSLLQGASENGRIKVALDAYLEGIRKGVLALSTSVDKPREILLCGRVSRVHRFRARVEEALASDLPARRVECMGKQCKESAQGAALLADGIAGGSFSRLFKTMHVAEASGTVLDHVCLPHFEENVLRKQGLKD